jgi:hypothetical protein
MVGIMNEEIQHETQHETQNDSASNNLNAIGLSWNKNTEAITRQMETKRLIKESLQNGIKKESIGFAIHKFKDMLDEDFHDGNIARVSEQLYKSKDWVRKGIFILIDGGSACSREIFGCACLFRFLVGDMFSAGHRVMNIRMCEIIANLSTFDKTRFMLKDKMCQAQCLFIQEVDMRDHPRDTNDCVMLLDAVFHYRRSFNKPTIITIHPNRELFTTPGVFGREFGNIITLNSDKDVLGVRLA